MLDEWNRERRRQPAIRDKGADRVRADSHRGQLGLVDGANVRGRLLPHEIAHRRSSGNRSRHSRRRDRKRYIQGDAARKCSPCEVVELLCEHRVRRIGIRADLLGDLPFRLVDAQDVHCSRAGTGGLRGVV